MSNKKNKNSNASFEALKDKASNDDAISKKLNNLNDQLDFEIDYFEYLEESEEPEDGIEQISLEEATKVVVDKPEIKAKATTKPANIKQKSFDTVAVETPTKAKTVNKIPKDATAILVRSYDVKRNSGIVNKNEHIEYQTVDENNQTVTLEVDKKNQENLPYGEVVNFGAEKTATKPVVDKTIIDKPVADKLVADKVKKSKKKIKTADKTEKNNKKYNTITGQKPKIIYPDKNKEKSDSWKFDPDAKITDKVSDDNLNTTRKIKETRTARETTKKSIKLSTIGAVVGSILIAAALGLFAFNYFDNSENKNDVKTNASKNIISPTNQLVIEKTANQKTTYFNQDFIEKIKQSNPAIESVQLTTQLTGDVQLIDSSSQQNMANALTIYQGDAKVTAGSAPVATNNILLSEQTAKLIAGDDSYISLLGQSINIRVDVPLDNGGHQSVQGQTIITGFTDSPYDLVPSETLDILYKAAKVDQVKPNRAIVNINDDKKANEVFQSINKIDSLKVKNIAIKNN